ncbi:MAG: SsrA-binding protein SmpB [Patescibacteria group bacterium]|nr:SsrA-binding protein SmpB [Patescibacteria group bacterium]
MKNSASASNKKAFHDYTISDTLEVGIKLTGPEVKSVKSGSLSLKESFVTIENGELWIKNLHISPYKFANNVDYKPTRDRKLLANKKEIASLYGATKEKGMTIVPTKTYLKNGIIKLEIGLAKSKKKWDKREDIKKRDLNKESKRGMM